MKLQRDCQFFGHVSKPARQISSANLWSQSPESREVFTMRYTIAQPPAGSSNWKILDEFGGVIFAGSYGDCEEWLDWIYQREAARAPSQLTPMTPAAVQAAKGETSSEAGGKGNKSSVAPLEAVPQSRLRRLFLSLKPASTRPAVPAESDSAPTIVE